VEKSNNEDSVNFFVAHREWLTDIVLSLQRWLWPSDGSADPRAKVRR